MSEAHGYAPTSGDQVPATGARWSDPVAPSAATRTSDALPARWTDPYRASSSAEPISASTEMSAAALKVRPLFSDGVLQTGQSVAVSTIVHMLAVVALGLWLLPESPVVGSHLVLLDIESPRENELPEVVLQLDSGAVPVAQEHSPLVTSDQLAATVTQLRRPEIPESIRQLDRAPPVRIDTTMLAMSEGRQLAAAVPFGTIGDASVPVHGYHQAMRRLTQEMIAKLAQGKLLVVWCFDRSGSMVDDREVISEYLQVVADELSSATTEHTDAVLMAVTSYGQQWSVHGRKPTAQLDQMRKLMATIPVDESGYEFQCQAVRSSLATFAGQAAASGRQFMLVLVTDESGEPAENMQLLETTIAEARAVRCPIYVLGREAVFGYPIVHVRTTVRVPNPAGGFFSQQFTVPIDRGPETAFIEQLQTDGFRPRRDAHPSGCGPYEQARMARETGGLFFLLPDTEVGLFDRPDYQYSIERMRPYLPDLSARVDYALERDKYPLRVAIWQVVNQLNPYDPQIAPYINLRQGFAGRPNEFARQVQAEVAKARQYVEYLNRAEQQLRQLQSHRDREVSFRWQANYDLICAQVLAYKARVFEYGAYLEMFVANPKPAIPPTPKHVLAGWNLQTGNRTVADSLTAAVREEARARFERVIADHAGTPWAARAELELQRGFGVELFPYFASTERVNVPRGRPMPAMPAITPPKL